MALRGLTASHPPSCSEDTMSLRGHPPVGPPGLWGQGHGGGCISSIPTGGGRGDTSACWADLGSQVRSIVLGLSRGPHPQGAPRGDTDSRRGEVTALLYHGVAPGSGSKASPPRPSPSAAPQHGAGWRCGEEGTTRIDICASCTYIHAGGDPPAPGIAPGVGRQRRAGCHGAKWGARPGDGGAVGQCRGVSQPLADPQPPAAPQP